MGLLSDIENGAYLRKDDVVKLQRCRLYGVKIVAFLDTPVEYKVVGLVPSTEKAAFQVGVTHRNIGDSKIIGDCLRYPLIPIKQKLAHKWGATPTESGHLWTHSVRLELIAPVFTFGVVNHGKNEKGWFDYLPSRYSASSSSHDLFLRPYTVTIPLWILDSLVLKIARKGGDDEMRYGKRLEFGLDKGGFWVVD